MKRALFALLSLALPALALAQKPPEIKIGDKSVSVSGIAAKGDVVLYSVAREVAPDEVATLVRRSEVLTDEDGDGAVELELEGGVPLRSIWVAVDLASGGLAAATPEGYPLRQVAWRGRGLGRESVRADRVEDARSYADVLVVRPGQGAWRVTVGDGSAEDEDGTADGKVAVALDRLQPLGRSAATSPQRFSAQDVVVLIDPNRMELSVAKAGAALSGGAR